MMKKILFSLLVICSAQSFAKIADSAEVGCQLYVGEQKVFHDLRKFNISEADESGVRVLDAYLVEKEGTCEINNEELLCEYENTNGRKIKVTIDLEGKSSGEVEGIVESKGLIFTKSHQVSCDILKLK